MADDLTVVAPPRIGEITFTQVLECAASPAAPDAHALYQVCVQTGLDPAIALAFFAHESSYGTRGLTKTHQLKNWGNVRRPYGATRAIVLDIPGRGPFAKYPSWVLGLEDWCDRLKYRYGEQQGLTTVRQVTPVYAPATDNNDPGAYADTVIALVSRWQRSETEHLSLHGPPLRELAIVDLTDLLPHASWLLPVRATPPTALTLHYNGPAVAFHRQADPGLVDQLVLDARWQMRPGALGAPTGGDGLQYHYVIAVDGTIYQTRDPRRMAWHCGDERGNRESLAIHFPIGGTQDVTEVQWFSGIALCTALMDEYTMHGRQVVYGHQEWPEASTLCPGPHIMQRLKQWRDQATSEGAGIYRLRSDIAAANVREGPGRNFPVALAGKAIMWPGDTLDADKMIHGEAIGGDSRWYHRRDSLGFVHASLVQGG